MPRPVSQKIPGGERPFHRFPRFAGALSALFGVLVIIGWHAHWPLVVQISSNAVPMQYNTACCLVLSGMGLLLLATRYRRLPPWLGGIVTGFAGIVLVEYLAGV